MSKGATLVLKYFQFGERRPWLLETRSSKWFICMTVSIAVFTDIFLYGLIVPVIPFALEQRAGVAHDKVQYWVAVLIAIYGAALLAGSPVCGWIADQTSSRRTPLLLGLLALGATTALLNVGSNIPILVVGRILQGISAAVVWTVGLALLVDTVGPKDVGHAMGYVAFSMSMGILLAPLLGGIVFDHGGYNAVFGICYGLIALDVALRLVMVEKKVAARWLRDDVGAGNKSRGPEERTEDIPCPAPGTTNHEDFALREEPSTPTTCKSESELPQNKESPSPQSTIPTSSPSSPNSSTTSFGSTSAASTRPSSYRCRRIHLPPIVTLLGSIRVLACLWGCVAQASILTSFDGTLPLFVSSTFSWGPTGAGLIFLPATLPSLCAPLLGRVSDRHGARWPATAGFVLMTPSLVLLRLATRDALAHKALLCALLALIGLGCNAVLGPLMAEMSYILEAKERARPGAFGPKGAYAQAYGLFNVAYAAGCMIGPLWGGMMRDRFGWGTTTWTLGLLAGVSAVPVVLLTGGRIWGKKKNEEDGANQRDEESGGEASRNGE
ncbi:MFS transporter [Lineolata rhizophorae]|uniref:MFS transporter n=1 Tax=Lineolata rhizophorae TaxID=578093 RepID=A0A6A6NPA1_9PEZI|nr:MFS transporter [Lineolata rhizophorae]